MKWLAILLVVASCAAAEVPDNVRVCLDRGEQQRVRQETRVVEELAAAKVKLKEAERATGLKREAKQKRIDEARRAVEVAQVHLNLLREVCGILPADIDPPDFRVGVVGTFRLQTVRVLQVVDENNALVEYAPESHNPDYRPTIWMKGFGTRKAVDGQLTEITEVLEFTGTKRYEAVSGASRTVLVAEPIDLKPYTQKRIAPPLPPTKKR